MKKNKKKQVSIEDFSKHVVVKTADGKTKPLDLREADLAFFKFVEKANLTGKRIVLLHGISGRRR